MSSIQRAISGKSSTIHRMPPCRRCGRELTISVSKGNKWQVCVDCWGMGPRCSEHMGLMYESQKNDGTYYCPTKTDGAYCTRRINPVTGRELA